MVDWKQLRANRRLWENKAKEVLKMSPQQLKNSQTDEDDDNTINETFAPGNTNINGNSINNKLNNNNDNNNDNNNQFMQQHLNNNNNNNNAQEENLMQQHHQTQQLHEEIMNHNNNNNNNNNDNMQYEDINDINMLQQQQQFQSQHLAHFKDENNFKKPKDFITIRQLNTQSLKESI